MPSTDTKGRPIRFIITAGQFNDYTGAAALLKGVHGSGVPMTNLPQNASLHSEERIAPSTHWIKTLRRSRLGDRGSNQRVDFKSH